MNALQIEERGLLIPPEYLSGLTHAVRVRRIKGGILIESEDQAEAREALSDLVARLREAAADDPLDPTEIARLVDGVRDERASHR
jgi:hypothetical protein